MVIKDIDAYIKSLQVRIDNLFRKNYDEKRLKLQDALDIIKHDHYNNVNVQKAMLALNCKLIAKEGGKGFSYVSGRSAQTQANFMRR